VLCDAFSDRLLGQPRKIEPDSAAYLVKVVGKVDRPIRHTHILAMNRPCAFLWGWGLLVSMWGSCYQQAAGLEVVGVGEGVRRKWKVPCHLLVVCRRNSAEYRDGSGVARKARRRSHTPCVRQGAATPRAASLASRTRAIISATHH